MDSAWGEPGFSTPPSASKRRRQEGREDPESHCINFLDEELADMRSGSNEWQNIQTVIRSSCARLAEAVKHQGQAHSSLSSTVAGFSAIISELTASTNAVLENTGPLQDIVRDMQRVISALTESRNSVADEVTRVSTFADKLELRFNDFMESQLRERQLLWQEMRAIQKVVAMKANVEEVTASLKKKVDVTKLNQLMDSDIRVAINRKAEAGWVAQQLELKANGSVLTAMREELSHAVTAKSLGQQLALMLTSKSFEEHVARMSIALDSKADGTVMRNSLDAISLALASRAESGELEILSARLEISLAEKADGSEVADSITALASDFKARLDAAATAAHKNTLEHLAGKASKEDFLAVAESLEETVARLDTKIGEVTEMREASVSKAALLEVVEQLEAEIALHASSADVAEALSKIETRLNTVDDSLADSARHGSGQMKLTQVVQEMKVEMEADRQATASALDILGIAVEGRAEAEDVSQAMAQVRAAIDLRAEVVEVRRLAEQVRLVSANLSRLEDKAEAADGKRVNEVAGQAAVKAAEVASVLTALRNDLAHITTHVSASQGLVEAACSQAVEMVITVEGRNRAEWPGLRERLAMLERSAGEHVNLSTVLSAVAELRSDVDRLAKRLGEGGFDYVVSPLSGDASTSFASVTGHVTPDARMLAGPAGSGHMVGLPSHDSVILPDSREAVLTAPQFSHAIGTSVAAEVPRVFDGGAARMAVRRSSFSGSLVSRDSSSDARSAKSSVSVDLAGKSTKEKLALLRAQQAASKHPG